jgi:threonylcarbamoyladenosine tRNA methylthiotransferase MtaB
MMACLMQAREMVTAGSREIVLTGVNVGDYRGASEERLFDLLRALARIDGLERLRISSIEPNLLTDEIIGLVSSHPRLCRHFHVPLQSGSESVLRRMRRRYTARTYRELIERIVTRIPDCGIGVDVIVGFPGETEAEFDETYRFLQELPVSYLHVFTYSEREGTPAAVAGRPVDGRVRQERNTMLRVLSQKKRHAFYASHLGKEQTVLTESGLDGTFRLGFTDNYVRVGISGVEENRLVRARITGVGEDRCSAEPVGEAA